MILKLVDYILLYLTISVSVFIVAWYGAAESTWGFGIIRIFLFSMIIFLIIYFLFFKRRFAKRQEELDKQEKQNQMYSDL